MAAPQRMSPSLFLSPSRLSLFTRWLALAVCFFSLACPDHTAEHHPNSNTYKSHRQASGLKQLGTVLQQQARTYTTFLHSYTKIQAQLASTIIHSHSLEFHTGKLKRPAGPTFFCWAQLVHENCVYDEKRTDENAQRITGVEM